MPGGKKQVDVELVAVGLKLPVGLHDEMVRLIRGARSWADRQEFIAEAIREKLEHERSKPGRLSAAAEKTVRDARVA